MVILMLFCVDLWPAVTSPRHPTDAQTPTDARNESQSTLGVLSSITMRYLTTLGLLIALASCGKDSSGPTEYALPDTPTPAAMCATFAPIARAVTNQANLPAWLDAFARVIPGGYAGHDVTRLMLVDTTRFGAAKDNINALVFCEDFPRHLAFALPTNAVAAARYDFTRLFAWDNSLGSALASTKGVSNRRFDLAHNQIVVTVMDASAASTVRRVARGIGVPDNALSTVIAAR